MREARAPRGRAPDGSGEVVIDLRDRSKRTLPLVDLAADYAHHREGIDAAMVEVLERGDFILGNAVTDFESEFAALCGAAHAVGVDSGFSAIELMLRAFDIGPGDEVITAANTFYSTVRPIEVCGARPVLVDVDPSTRTLDPGALADAVTARTRAVVPVHLHGHCADMDPINRIAEANDLVVLEDACQAHGARYKGRRAGSLGHAAAFSFYPSKNLGAFGDAGMVVTDLPEIDERIRRARNLGTGERYHHDQGGFNRRLDTVQAAVLRVKLTTLDEANAARRRLAAKYLDALDGIGVETPTVATWAEHVQHLFVIRCPDRDGLAMSLDEAGVQTGVHYPVPVHLQAAFAWLGHAPGDFPVTEALAESILSLPMHPYLDPDDIDRIVSVIAEARPARLMGA